MWLLVGGIQLGALIETYCQYFGLFLIIVLSESGSE
jgi:hypothetical protein